MEFDGTGPFAQTLAQICGDGFGPGLAQRQVAVAGTFRRGAGIDIELDADGIAVAIFRAETLFETLPIPGIVGIGKIGSPDNFRVYRLKVRC